LLTEIRFVEELLSEEVSSLLQEIKRMIKK